MHRPRLGSAGTRVALPCIAREEAAAMVKGGKPKPAATTAGWTNGPRGA